MNAVSMGLCRSTCKAFERGRQPQRAAPAERPRAVCRSSQAERRRPVLSSCPPHLLRVLGANVAQHRIEQTREEALQGAQSGRRSGRSRRRVSEGGGRARGNAAGLIQQLRCCPLEPCTPQLLTPRAVAGKRRAQARRTLATSASSSPHSAFFALTCRHTNKSRRAQFEAGCSGGSCAGSAAHSAGRWQQAQRHRRGSQRMQVKH